jgi:hypothetical protein
VVSHPSAVLRAGSFAKYAKDGAPFFVVVSTKQQVPFDSAQGRFLTGLSARFAMTRVFRGLAASWDDIAENFHGAEARLLLGHLTRR